MESFFVNQRENIFRNVEVLIYVFDIQSADLKKDLMYYRSTLDALSEHSPGASIFCLVHKMDLVADDCRALVRNVAILLTDDTFFRYYTAVIILGLLRARETAYCHIATCPMRLLRNVHLRLYAL